MFPRLPKTRFFHGKKDRKASSLNESQDHPDQADSTASEVTAAVDTASLTLPGTVPLSAERRSASRWQPLFRDPTFGGSIESKNQKLALVMLLLSFVFLLAFLS